MVKCEICHDLSYLAYGGEMELNRKKYLDVLESWAKSQKSKPLLLWGARQVGKTHLMLKAANLFFSEHYYLNFEQDKQLAPLFRDSLSNRP